MERQAARALDAGAAVLNFAVLADSGLEHYRGRFRNRAMYIPLAVAAQALSGSLNGLVGYAGRSPTRARHVVTAAAGAVGLGFHAYNILKRPGGLCWQNLFYAAPAGAPAALTLAGLLGLVADELRSGKVDVELLARRTSALVAAGIAGSAAEAWLLHFRGAFHNPAMLLPVTIPPAAAALLARDALGNGRHRETGLALKLTAVLGFGGVGLHVWGVSRGMGGWRNWRQNLLSGPPLPAPPAFTGLAIAGLGLLHLLGGSDA